MLENVEAIYLSKLATILYYLFYRKVDFSCSRFHQGALSCHEFLNGFVEYTCSEDEVFYADTFVYSVLQFDYFS